MDFRVITRSCVANAFLNLRRRGRCYRAAMDMNIGENRDEANWASEMARELISARVIAFREGSSDLYVETLARALDEAVGAPQGTPKESVRRLGHLIVALSLAGAVAIVGAGEAISENEGPEVMLRAVAEQLSDAAAKGKWF